MDKLNGLLYFLELVEKAELPYALRKHGDSLQVSITLDGGPFQVYFTGDGEVLFYHLEDGQPVPCEEEIMEGLFHTMS